MQLIKPLTGGIIMNRFKSLSSLFLAILILFSMVSISLAVPVSDKAGKNFQNVNPDGTASVDVNKSKTSFMACAPSVSLAATTSYQQLLIIQHPVTSNKKVSITKVTANFESSSAAAVLTYAMTYMTSITPASSGTAILPASFDPTDITSDAVVQFSPSTAGSTTTVYSYFATTTLSVGTTTPSTGTANPNMFTLYDWKNSSGMKPFILRAFYAEGYAVNLKASANSTVVSTICTYFTEE
jgi:hypothetical protein